jgi:paraquat-inducible protein B
MAKPVNRTLIGAFLLGAVILAVAGVLIFGSGELLGDTKYIIMYYDGSVKGLTVGAPVVFRGVKIGSVTKISLIFNRKDLTFLIPVVAELDMDKIDTIGGPVTSRDDYFKELIGKGGRAQLQVSNFVTGQLMVGLDFFPEQPARFVGLDKRYTEIPTVQSSMDEISRSLAHLPMQDLVKKVTAIFAGLDKLLNSPEAGASLSLLRQDLQEARTTLKTVNSQLSPIVSNVRDTTENLKTVSERTGQALAGQDGIPAQVGQTLAAARSTLLRAEQTLASLDSKTSENSALMNDVGRTLDELSNTARSFRILSDYLEQHPEAMLKGKIAPEGEYR